MRKGEAQKIQDTIHRRGWILGFRLSPWPAARQVLGLGSRESGLEGAPGYTKLLGRGEGAYCPAGALPSAVLLW